MNIQTLFKNRMLLAVIIIIVCGLLLAFLFNKNNTLQLGSKISPTVIPQKPQMMLEFTPSSTSAVNSTFSANLVFDSYGNPAAGVTVVISYKPNEVASLTLTPFKDPTSAISNALDTTFASSVPGVITRIFAVPQKTPEQKGRGIIGVIRGKLQPKVKTTTVLISINSKAVSRTLPYVNLGVTPLEIKSQ